MAQWTYAGEVFGHTEDCAGPEGHQGDCISKATIATLAGSARRQPVDPELFKRTAPQWNCVDYPGDGMHYAPGASCLWCGMTSEQIAAEPWLSSR